MDNEIEVPDWVPPIIIQIANCIAGAGPGSPAEVEAMLKRLVIDPRMKEVWKELRKHKRIQYKTSSEGFYNIQLPSEILSWPALATSWRKRAAELRALGNEDEARQFERWATAISSEAPHDTDQLDEDVKMSLAMATLFCVAVSLFSASLETIRRADFDSFIASLRARGEHARADAYLKQSTQAANIPYFVTRQRTDARVEAFVKGVGAQTKAMFDTSLYGVVAVLTNVAFENAQYNQQSIRALLRE